MMMKDTFLLGQNRAFSGICFSCSCSNSYEFNSNWSFLLIALLLMGFGLAGCAGYTSAAKPGGPPPPSVTSFTANPASINGGTNSTLSWATSGATSISISPGGFTSTLASGSTSVAPAATTTYTLTAANSAGSVTSTVTVSVTTTTGSACAGMSVGIGGSFNGFVPFPNTNTWNEDISTAPVDPNSSSIINYVGSTAPVHPD